MFRSLSIERFRGFRSLEVDGLERFNLFLGRNNIGKTALLEAIFLLLGPTNPQLSMTVSEFRGIDQFRNDPEDIWGWLFYEKDMAQSIVLTAKTVTGASRKLVLSLGEPKQIRVRRKSPQTGSGKKQPGTATTELGPGQLILSYEDESGIRTQTKAFLTLNGIGIELGKSPRKVPTSVFVSARGGYSPENPERFSKLEEVGKEEQIVSALRIIEPRLKKLAILMTGNGPMIHGDIGLGRLVPIPLMGEGIGRLLTLLLAIASSEKGVTIIDEVETGIHHAAMPRVWSAIAKLARELDVQVFATTHSWECIKAGFESFSENSMFDFRLQRLDRSNGEVHATSYDKDMIDMALTAGMELR